MADDAEEKHVSALDGVRAIAILAVFGYHALSSHRVYGRWAVVHYGTYGVDAFFVLSGFLITLRLFSLTARHELAPRARWRTFFLRRCARIFPLYYLTLALMPFFGPKLGMVLKPEEWPWLVTYTANVKTALERRWVGPAHFWSLCVEEQFYLFFPAFVLTRARRWLAPIWITAAVGAAAARALLATYPDTAVAAAVLPPLHFDAFGFGIAAAVCAREQRVVTMRAPAFYALGALAGVVMCVIGFDRHPSRLAVAVLPTALCLATAALILALWNGRLRYLAVLLGAWPLAGIGRISYGIYLAHPFVIVAVWQSKAPWLPSTQLSKGLLALAVSIALALVSWFAFERPILSHVRRATTR